MQTWSVGVLCYNEAETLDKVVTELRDVLLQVTNTFEIIIIDDYSTDGSREIAKGLQNKYSEVNVILHDVNKGIGEALRTIYANTKYENIGVIPGDAQFDPTEYIPFKDIPEHTFISFYRKENLSYSLFRNILSAINKKLNKLFIGIDLKDVNWTKIYKKIYIDQLDLQLTSSLVESEICAKLIFLGNTVIEMESKYLPRVYGVSKGASHAILKKAINDTLLLVSIMNKFKNKIKAKTK